MKNNRRAKRFIKNPKKRGEWAEMVFAARAMELALLLARPWGESSGYDFTVDQGARIVRVQVKCTIFELRTGGYVCSLKSDNKPYKKNTFDFVAAYVIPENVWYVLPEKKVRGMYSVALYPNLESSKYNVYKEAWHLLRGGTSGVVDCIQACAEECSRVESPLLATNSRNGAPCHFMKLLLWRVCGRGSHASSRAVRAPPQ